VRVLVGRAVGDPGRVEHRHVRPGKLGLKFGAKPGHSVGTGDATEPAWNGYWRSSKTFIFLVLAMAGY
jgi:hypothetical protein